MGTMALLPALLLQGSTVALQVDLSRDVHPISPYIYGTNQPDWTLHPGVFTFARQGGNRMTAYNWENNASNAGSDWLNQNDDYLGGGNTPAEVLRGFAASVHAHGATPLVTVPIVDYVAADKNGGGDVNQTPDYLNVRFRKNRPAKGATFADPPDLTDAFVYQDEAVWALRKRLNTKRPVWYSLDNEPDLWAFTHSRIHPDKVTYAELYDRGRRYSQAIKAVDPTGLVFGAVNYGWNGFQNLQEASDNGGRFFIDWYLQQFKGLADTTGKRHLDALDIHWYSEARGANKRVLESGTETALLDARMQAPRSLWDPTYTEDSWIAQWMTSGPIRLIPRMKDKIAANYPGTKLAITEWNHGGGNHISGAIATADSLGVFGREGLFAAAYWNWTTDESFAYAGFDMFRNFDRKGARFGDTSVYGSSGDLAKVTVYGSVDSLDPSQVTVVVINKAFTATSVSLTLKNYGSSIRVAKAFRLGAGSAVQAAVALPAVVSGSLNTSLPATSVTTYRLVRTTGAVDRVRG